MIVVVVDITIVKDDDEDNTVREKRGKYGIGKVNKCTKVLMINV